MGAITGNNSGLYAMACEKSKFKDRIDLWLNEGKSYLWIQNELDKLGDKISDKSIGKYARYREEMTQKALMEDPEYQNKITVMNQTMVDEVSKVKQVNILNHLANTIEHCAELIDQSIVDNIKIRTIQDLRYMQTTMLEALKLHGDMALMAQKYAAIQNDPQLIRPVENMEVKTVMINIMEDMDSDNRQQLIDSIRNSFKESK